MCFSYITYTDKVQREDEMEIKVKLNGFDVPEYVFPEGKVLPRQAGLVMSQKWGLSELDENTLSELCDKFRADVFAKAGKADPKLKTTQNNSPPLIENNSSTFVGFYSEVAVPELTWRTKDGFSHELNVCKSTIMSAKLQESK